LEILLQSAASAEALDLESLGRIVIGRSGSYIADCASRGSFGAVFWVVTVFSVLALLVVPYFLGSINFGIIISKLFHGEDIREYGSGNAGMTNMLRTYGKRDAAITLIGDALKAVVAVILGRILFGISGGYVAGLTCILGHAFPCYYKFKGGKGVVVTAATIAVIDWRIFLVLLGIFILVVAFSKYISLGSVCGMLVFPLLVQVWDRGLSINVLLSCLISALVIFLHRGNIKRIYNGTESKLSLSKTDKHKKSE